MDALALLLLAWVVVHLRRRKRPLAPAMAPPSAKPVLVRLTVADLAFDYERALLEFKIREATRTRAITVAAQVIVPLAGPLRLDQLTPTLAAAVRAVLAAQMPDGWAARVWADMLSFGRCAPSSSSASSG